MDTIDLNRGADFSLLGAGTAQTKTKVRATIRARYCVNVA